MEKQKTSEIHPSYQSQMRPENMVPTMRDVPLFNTRSVEELTRAVLNEGAKTAAGENLGGSK